MKLNKQIKKPKISIIIPVYNAEKYLRETLNSLIDQSFHDVEIICVNDGSTDDSFLILADYAKRDDRLKILNTQNRGAGFARNSGLLKAKGETVIFLDSDDIFLPKMLEVIWKKYLLATPDILIFNWKSYKNGKITREASGIRKTIYYPLNLDKRVSHCFAPKEIATYLFQLTNPAPWNKLYKRKFLTKHRLLFGKTKSANDLKFVFLSLALAKSISILDRTLLYYRSDASNSLTKRIDPNSCFIDAYLDLANNLKKKNLYSIYEQSFINALLSASLWTLNKINKKEYPNFLKIVKKEIFEKYEFEKYSINYFFIKKFYLKYKLLEYKNGNIFFFFKINDYIFVSLFGIYFTFKRGSRWLRLFKAYSFFPYYLYKNYKYFNYKNKHSYNEKK